jgi:cytochrome c oxidase cbb3-type subunit 3/ubiquinol-cytochrome c reductase cytochrome c subunit
MAWLGLVLAFGCDVALPGKPDPADRPQTPAQITSFEYLFARNCAGCHGAEGKLGPAPPLNDPIFLAIVSQDDLVRVITGGRAGTPMPAFGRQFAGTLTEEQIHIVAAGVKERWRVKQPADKKLPAYAVATSGEPPAAEEVARGAKVFERACADCHGADGEGSGGDESPGRINDPALLSLISNQGLRRIVITGRHDLGMPNFAGDEGRSSNFEPLSSEEIADVVALLASWRTAKR